MEKSVIIGDFHLGIKSFDLTFFENQKIFFLDQLIPYMKENEIKRIYQLGDFFDNRKIIDVNFLYEVIELLNEMQSRLPELEMIILLGNHDIYFRDSLKVSMIKMLAEQFDFIRIIEEPTMIGNIQLFPWLVENKLNKEDIKGDVIMGHFEIKDFDMVRGHQCEDGIDGDIFEGKTVLSGHFHLKGDRSNIHYIGTPYQLTWGDFGDRRGFYVMHGADLMFIQNDLSRIFVKIIFNSKESIIIKFYDDYELQLNIEEFIEFVDKNSEELKRFFLKIIVFSDGFEDLLEAIKDKNILFNFVNNIELKEMKNQAKDADVNMVNSVNANEFIEEYISKSNVNDKDRLKKKLKELFSILKEKN